MPSKDKNIMEILLYGHLDTLNLFPLILNSPKTPHIFKSKTKTIKFPPRDVDYLFKKKLYLLFLFLFY